MAYTEHTIVKPEPIGELAANLIEHDLTLPALFKREGWEQFKGKRGDKLTYRVPGRLPYRKRQFRDPRETPLIFDVYKEGTTEITWGGRIYSGVEVTDEQQDFDLNNWEPIISAQSRAVSQGVIDDMVGTVENAPFEVTIGGAEQALYSAIIEARRVLGKFRVPGNRYLIVGSDFEAAILNDKRITLAQNSGDSVAEGALRDAILGRVGGFTVVVDQTIAGDESYAVVDSAFVQVSGAPGVPRSVYAGTSIALPAGTSARWIMQYDSKYQVDMSVLDTYVGSAPVKDMFLPKSVLETGSAPKSFDPDNLKSYFVRGVKLTLGGTSVYPSASAKPDLVAETGVSDAQAWAPPAGGDAAEGPAA